MGSLWEQTCVLPEFPRLEQDLDTDVLIVGGGMAGLLCAWELHRAGVDYALVEAGRIGGGVTGGTTAKLTVQHGLIYHKLGARAGEYYQANRQALESFRRLCRQIPCDFEEKDAYVYSLTDRRKLEKEVQALEKLGAPASFVTETELPFPVLGAVRLENQGQFHPLKFLAALAKELHIYERTAVEELVGTNAKTPRGMVRARRVVIATHFPILNKHGSYFLKMYQHRSYVLALEGEAQLQGMYVDESPTGLSLRCHGQLLLLGGGGHRTGKPGGSWEELDGVARQYCPGARERYRWAAQDCMTLDRVPYVGAYSASTRGLYTLTGFNKWGMTGAMAAAAVLAEQLQGRKTPFDDLFSPSRSMLKPQLALNTLHALQGWLTPTTPRCPHLGCALRWNPREHSWDCPCHGSRFAGDGTLLSGPANADLKRKSPPENDK